MKRKFSFNLAPIKISTTQETRDKSTQEPTSSHAKSSSQSHFHRRSFSNESVYDSSAHISRRVLDTQTEQQLRAACRLILQNFKPSDYGMENVDPKLDFGGIQRWKEHKDPKPQPGEVKVRMPTGAPADVVRKSSNRTRTRTKADNEIRARAQAGGLVRANTSEKRTDFAWLDDRDDKREQNLKKSGRGPSIDMPRSATFKNKGDSGVSTPVTVTSTLAYKKSISTGPTSATQSSGIFGSRSRRPSQPENIVVVEALHAKVRPATTARPPSRSDSIRKGINYVFSGPRSRTVSRKPSQDSLHTTHSITSQNSSQDLQRSGSVTGWRNWVRPRSRSTSRPGTANGHQEESEQLKKHDPAVVDLNRELPPLPGLDTWRDPILVNDETGKSPISPGSGPHIASLMRPKTPQSEHSFASRIQHGKSDSDSLAVHYKHNYPVRKSSRRDLGSFSFPDPKRMAPYSPLILDLASTVSSSTSNLERMGSSTHTRQRSGGSLTSPSSPMGEMNPDIPVNFSRKISTDAASRGPVFINEVNISKKDEQKSKLKKVFSGWMNKKTKKDDWMQKIEKDGVKEGVMVQESTAATVVRY